MNFGSRARTLFDLARELGPASLPRLGSALGGIRSDREHLRDALTWLRRSQDVCGGRGSSAMRHLGRGWDVAYPETSGYLIATFLNAARFTGDDSFRARAVQLADWEVEIQTASGGVLSNPQRTETRVFNTGQVLLGWCAIFEELREPRWLEAAVRAGDYLIRTQEADGRWERDTYCGARTYHARVDWGLLRLAQLSADQRFAACALRNLDWVFLQARPSGWFARCGFFDEPPVTHVLGYTLRGLLECHALSAPRDLLPPVLRAADALAQAIDSQRIDGVRGLLPASFAEDWSSSDSFSCLTGLAQLSIVFARLARLTGEQRYQDSSRALVAAACAAQRNRPERPDVHGALGGSHPLRGTYCAFSFPNWATKFLADALLFQLHREDRAYNVLA